MVLHNSANVISRTRRHAVPRRIGDICKQLAFKRRHLHGLFRLKNFEFGTKMFSSTQNFSIHFNILEKRILYMISPVNSNDRELTVQSWLLSSKTFSKSDLHEFFSVFGYILLFLGRVIVKSLNSVSTSEESSV